MVLSAKVVYTFGIMLVNLHWTFCVLEREMYLATAHYERLLGLHGSVMIALELFVEDEEKLLLVMKRYLSRYKEENQWATIEDDYMGNPLNAFTVIKRLTTDLHQINKLIADHKDRAEYFADFTKDEKDNLPTENDLTGAALAVRRVQTIYKLDIEKLSQGVIDYGGVETYSLPMTSNDCYEMSRILYENSDFRGSKNWAEMALLKNRLEGYEHLHTFHEDYLDNVNTQLETQNKIKPITGEIDVWDQNVWDKQAALCRNDMEIPRNISKRLSCYLSRNSPFLQLAPVKTEQLYIDPDIFLYYDVISDNEIEHLRQESQDELVRAEDDDEEYPTEVKTATYRTCKNTWITDEMSDVAARISRRITDLTGLDIEMSEDLQIVNYGIGGHYDAHYDFDQIHEPPSVSGNGRGNRLATVLFYSIMARDMTAVMNMTVRDGDRNRVSQTGGSGLSVHTPPTLSSVFRMNEVTQGGATVFIELGLSVFPVKNAALVWTNLLPSGEGDLHTLHAACPVLMGTKWTATKWLHQTGQEFIRPCNLEYQREEDVRPIPKPILRVRLD